MGQDDPAAGQGQMVSGEVRLFQSGSSKSVKDASKIVVWLVPLNAHLPVRFNPEITNYQMVQRNKTFEPHLLIVPIGSVVVFPNLDPWFHSIFSLYRGKRFDLGLYESGSQKVVKFDRSGPSYLFCNIHPQMAAVILTVDSDYFGVSDKSGRVSIPNVPEGSYMLRVWYEDATQKSLQELERQIVVGTAHHTLPTISVAVAKQNLLNHKNKYGQDYDPKGLTPDY
jgi:hypothetical protein